MCIRDSPQPKTDTGIRKVISNLADLAVKGIASGKRKVSDALRDIIGRLSGPEPADTGEENNEGDFPEFPPFPSINFPDWPKQPEPVSYTHLDVYKRQTLNHTRT